MMHPIAQHLLRLFGLARPKPTTRTQRVMRRLERMLVALAFAYFALRLHPQILFAHSVTRNGVTVHAREPIPDAAFPLIARARDMVDRGELAEPGRREQVFLCNSPWIYALFAPMSIRAFACSVPLTDHIFIASGDFEADLARSRAAEHNRRSLSGVMAHEMTHGLIRHRLGWFQEMRLANWVAEGFCDHVARESSFPEAEGLRLFALGGPDPSPSYRYFAYRKMVDYLVEGRHLDFAGVVARAGDAQAVEAEARSALGSK